MKEQKLIEETRQILTGLSIIIFPLVFIYAFAGHPDLLEFKILSPAELINRAHGSPVLHFGHALVTLATALLVVTAVHFMNILRNTRSAWPGLIGGGLAVTGALMLAADKGALCLTMSALDTLSEAEFQQMMPGLLAMFAKKGYLILVWGLLLLPVGFIIQAAGLIREMIIPRWRAVLFLVGVLFIGTPDGVELINLSAAVLVAIALVPYGAGLLKSGFSRSG